ncbi:MULTISPECIES: histidine kinase [unclassified Pseudonocardia]|uniref:sensor histidine kinase n=1 Tax=unclassified Pseudonocardia TaxID=2619320 RepID=UPI0002F80BA7|nr:histidine kinase [Pseudonocardia sp. Ae707_Ps1]
MGGSPSWTTLTTPTGWAAGRTCRRVLHVLLGAVVLLPYLGAAWVLVRTADGGVGAGAMVGLTVTVVLLAIGVTVLPGVRELLIAAARALLGVDLPDDPAGSPVPLTTRIRAAGWLLVCTALGAVSAAALLVALPVTVALVATPWEQYPPLPTGLAAWWTAPLALLPVPAVLTALAAAGALQARLAPALLGPDPGQRRAAELAEQLARAHRRADRQAERTRLARELHDSVGHALTVSTMQAAAAAELLSTDPSFVARALDAIATTGRAALDDLDHVLGLLRDDGDTPQPVRDLDSLEPLLASARAAGLDLHHDVDPAAGVPAVVSREAYRLAQEGLTNALRHAGPGPVELRLRRSGSGLHLTITNTITAGGDGARERRVGRGLAGARERVALLGGTVRAAPDGDRWVLHARFPSTPTGPSGPGSTRGTTAEESSPTTHGREPT